MANDEWMNYGRGMRTYKVNGVACTKEEFEIAVGRKGVNMARPNRRESITAERLKRFKGILKSMQDEHSQHAGWSYQKRGNLLRLTDFVISEIELLWEEMDVWKEQFERQGEKRDRWKEENEILKKGFELIDAVYPIECTNDRACQGCESIQPDDGTLFTHKTDCRWLKAARLL